MLEKAKKALRVTAGLYDSEIMELLKAGKCDLEIAGVTVDGTIAYTVGTDGAVTDTSDVSDTLIQRALITYAAAHFGNPPNYDRLLDAYETQKVQLMHADGYTDYGEETGDAES